MPELKLKTFDCDLAGTGDGAMKDQTRCLRGGGGGEEAGRGGLC